MELREQQRKLELLVKRETMEFAAIQLEMELEIKLKWLQLKDTNGCSGDNLPSVSISLRAEEKTKIWLNSATNDLDGTTDRNLTVQEVNGFKSGAGAAPAESNPKPTITSTSFDLSAKKVAHFTIPARSSFPDCTNPTAGSIAANACISQPAILLLMGMKLPKLVVDKFSGDPLE